MASSPSKQEISAHALSGIRILDLSQNIAGAYCTKMLAGAGAEVIKIESPGGGGPLRYCGPFYKGKPGKERSIPHLWFNTGKKSVTLDLTAKSDKNVVFNLIQSADVVVESSKPGYLKKIGLDFDEQRKINPSLIFASISNFGQTGPYQHYEAEEIVIYALTGQMYSTGDPTRSPLTTGPSISQITAGMHAYIAILMMLLRRDRNDTARHIDVSVYEAGLENLEMKAMPFWRTNQNPSRAELSQSLIKPWDLYQTKDGYVAILGAPFRHWQYLARLFPGSWLLSMTYRILVKSLSDQGGFLFRKFIGKHLKNRKVPFFKYVHRLTREWAACRTKQEAMQAGIEHGLAFAALPTLDEVLNSPQHKYRNFFTQIDHPETGYHSYCRAPFQMSRTPWSNTRAPLLGEHNQEIIDDLTKRHLYGFFNSVYSPTNSSKALFSLPLKGIRIIDLTHVEAGPHGTRILGDYGAEIIRVENPSRLCIFRGVSTRDGAYNKQHLWAQLNRNKRSLALNLKSEQGQTILRELVQQSDVIIDNFRGGVMKRLGMSYEQLREIKSDLIMISMSAFGASGPYANYPGYGGSIEAMSGLYYMTGYDDDQKPQRIREMDVVNGVTGACAVMTALIHRQKTSEGQYIDLSQMEATTYGLMGVHLLEYAMNGYQSLPMANRHWRFAPHGCYPCKGKDKWVVIVIRSEDEWRAFCQAIGHLEWVDDPRFATNESRRKNQDILDRLISKWTTSKIHLDVMNILQTASIPAGAVLNFKEVLEDPHARERDCFIKVSEKPYDLLMGLPFKISGIDFFNPSPGPRLGNDNEYVICQLLGHPAKEVKPIIEEELGTAFHLESYRQ